MWILRLRVHSPDDPRHGRPVLRTNSSTQTIFTISVYCHQLCLVSFINIDPFSKLDRTVAGRSSTTRAHKSNSRGNCGILRCRGPRSERRILSQGCLECVSRKTDVYMNEMCVIYSWRWCVIYSGSFIAVYSNIFVTMRRASNLTWGSRGGGGGGEQVT